MQARELAAILLDAPAVEPGKLDVLARLFQQTADVYEGAETVFSLATPDEIVTLSALLESRLAAALSAARSVMALRPRPSDETPEGF